MTDLVVLVPSRGRPANVARLIGACAKTCRADTLIHFGFDDDDPALQANLAALDWNVIATTQPRTGLASWTNRLADEHVKTLPELVPGHLASLGDDMVPVTDGWDVRLIEAAGPDGMAYPNDRRRDDIPEAIVISTGIVRELGWFALPELDHWYIDNVWGDLGRGASCLAYLPGVIVEHRHPNVTGERGDQTYWDANPKYAADLAAYQQWRMRRMRDDVKTVLGCRSRM